MQYIGNREKSTIINEIDGVTFITFPKLEAAGVKHAMSTRIGGVSSGYLGSMNLSYSRGDKKENVDENHIRFAQVVGYDPERLVFSDQVHKTVIRKVTEEDAGKGMDHPSDIIAIDGLMTNEKNIPLMTFYADCVPLFFYDPGKKVIAMAHSGWKGTVGKIGKKMMEAMTQAYGCKASDTICAIGPSICRDCYEVSEDVIDCIRDAFGDVADTLYDEKPNHKFQLDLHKACYLTLLEAGIKKEHIDVTDLCTCCNPDVLFSHRASHGQRGNLGAVMVLE